MSGGAKAAICVLLLAVLGGAALLYKFGNGLLPNPNKATPVEPVDNRGYGPLEPGPAVQVPFIFWGGDAATFHANGGLKTTSDSLFGKHGLNADLVPGDDFEKQVDDYLSGKSPFLRGTLSMLGQASQKLTAKPETTPVVFLQLTWSAGDHLVGRSGFRDLNDIKGKKIALQKGGPHVGMLNDILNTVKLKWSDVTIVWTDDVSGDKGPAEKFRTDPTFDACFCISPEMYELTSAPPEGSLKSSGDGTKKSVKGARVVVSTAHMSRSIADVYACRKDFYDKNKDWVERFVAGYLKASEEIVEVKNRASGKDKVAEDAYKKVIKLAQGIWIKDPAFKDAVTKEDDVDGLISDAVFVGLPGNETFFRTKGNLSGFEFKQAQALALPPDPTSDRHKDNPRKFLAHDMDYARIRKLGDLQGRKPTKPRITASAEDLEKEEKIFEFLIFFEANQPTFSPEKYGNDFRRALEQASLFGNSAVIIRGHADPSLMVQRFLNGAEGAGIIKGKPGASTFLLADGSTLDLKDKNSMKTILDIVAKNPNLQGVGGGSPVPARVQDNILNLQTLSDQRANAVRTAVVDYGSKQSLILEQSQLRSQGLGVTDPEEVFPQDEAGFARNRRVQVRIVKVPDGKVNTEEFELEK